MDMRLDEALRVIRDECRKHRNCVKCPLRRPDDKDRCSVTNSTTPEKWQLLTDPVEEPELMFRR